MKKNIKRKKNEKNINSINSFFIPFNGISMIESSAGTGKTFTIILLYLNLLLGINKKKKNF
ncbi:MAG: UvrD-helicase domain-containing protein [Buchnera aphidicola (Periphyllus lyropictus)]|uniref:UvrD-helicase domain-containing protein n=1 Tax=Buchnera aphidicola TaxID=9 RepID=UPI001ECFC085|nr:UvrD-helicase domain-containing protein [Buchnera aphidicola]NIH16528.1 UvrD-helicase domain-containing protein [Buchnera aphidicola (Periphyllus lyropictus)]